MNVVDPANPIPKYLQIRDWLKELIESGRYRPGDRLPSETTLASLCRVHRNTLRQAISELASEGILRKEKGRGTFVVAPPVSLKHRLERISSFSDDLDEAGITGNTRILKKGVEAPNEYVARALLLGSRSKVIILRRLRMGNGTPFIYEESYLPYPNFKPILEMDLTGSMYKILAERFKVVLARSQQTLRAVNLKGRIARILELTENAAGIFMESHTFDQNNMPVEVLFSYYRGDKYVFEVELGRYHIQEEGSPPWGR